MSTISVETDRDRDWPGCGVGKWSTDNTSHRTALSISKLEVVSGPFMGLVGGRFLHL